MRKRLTKVARSAIIMRSKETNRAEAIKKLEKDLLNGPLHCFGFHDKCSTDFCKTAKAQNNIKLSLKRTHNYFYQIQTAMLCTETKWCDFVVRTTVDLHVERIFFDDSFCNSFLQKVRYFYFDCILPQLTDPRETIREPTEWIENLTDWHNTVDILTSPSPSALHHNQDADEIQLTP